jgi:hypothetical protein
VVNKRPLGITILSVIFVILIILDIHETLSISTLTPNCSNYTPQAIQNLGLSYCTNQSYYNHQTISGFVILILLGIAVAGLWFGRKWGWYLTLLVGILALFLGIFGSAAMIYILLKTGILTGWFSILILVFGSILTYYITRRRVKNWFNFRLKS